MNKTIVAVVPMLILATLLVLYYVASASVKTEPFTSVELSISELSPKGEQGGFAMPASGASVELSFKQTGDQTWDDSATAVFNEDRAIDLKWVSTPGSGTGGGWPSGWTSGFDVCSFIAGTSVPDIIDPSGVSISSTQIGIAYNRHLSLVGDADIYTIECYDLHTFDPEHCADEGEFCSFDDTRAVRFGEVSATGTPLFTYRIFTDGTQCDVATFGEDPYPGESKECEVLGVGGDHTGTDSADLSLIAGWDDTPECSDGYDNADDEDTLYDAADPGCWTQPGEPWTYDPDDDDEDDGGWVPECSDGIDNDGDGEIDSPDDPGCADGNDNDEDDDSPTMSLTGCESDGVCVTNGGTLKIDDSDEVTLTWTSTNTDFCDSVGTFTNPSGNPTDYTDWSGVSEPSEGESAEALILACGNNGTPEVAEVIYVINPAIELVPYPNPPIIPAEGMPPSDPAQASPIISGYNPLLCYVEGPGFESAPSIQDMVDDGDLSGGSFEAQLNARGETTYTLTCYPDLNADDIADPGGEPVTDTAIFRILPEIQET